MRTLRTLVVPVALLAVLGAACTGDGGPGPTVTPSSPEPSDAGNSTFTPGSFRYANGGLVVTLEIKEHQGTMEVDNGSGYDLGKPDLSVLDGVTTKEFPAKVVSPKPVPDGGTATFQVEFPDEVTAKSLGLVILFFGGDNYGAFAPA